MPLCIMYLSMTRQNWAVFTLFALSSSGLVFTIDIIGNLLLCLHITMHERVGKLSRDRPNNVAPNDCVIFTRNNEE